jgi:hypothetical protein
MQLNEGGNVWPDVDPFTKAEAPDILKRAQQVMPPGIELIPVGSAGHKASSGDMDIMVDADQVLKAFGVKDEKTARAALKTSMIDRGVTAAQTGINVHLKIPNGEKFAQVDIMLVKNAGQVSKFHQHDYSIEKTPFKGVHKHILLSSMAKETRTADYPYGMMWSGFQGLFARDAAGKKADLITQDADEVATILLGPGASGADLGSVERILNKLPMGVKDPRVQHALADENWPKQDEAMAEDIKRIKELAGAKEAAPASKTKLPIKPPAKVKPATKPEELGQMLKSAGWPAFLQVEPPPMPQGQLQDGEKLEPQADGTTIYSGGFGFYTYDKAGKPIKYVTPNFSGISQSVDLITGNINIRYIAGPLDVSANFDKTGKPLDSMQAQYDLGLGVLGIGKDNGITTKSWTARGPSEEDPITQKDMYAMGNKDKEATYNRAMRQVQQPPEDKAALEAMLRIARLR